MKSLKQVIRAVVYLGIVNILISCSQYSPTRTPSCDPQSPGCELNYLARVEKDEREYANIKAFKWIDSQVRNFVNKTDEIQAEIPSILLREQEIEIRAKRNPFRNLLYENEIIEHGERPLFMTDKLYMSKVLEHYLGDDFKKYHLKTLGLKEYLSRHHLVDENGRVTASKEEIYKLLELEFPNGLIAKPAIGMSSGGKGFYNNLDEIVELIVKSDGEIYGPELISRPYHWDKVKRFTSGEEFILQEKLDFGSDVGGKNKFAQLNEFRVHTFYDKVVEGATETRWKTKNSSEMNSVVNEYVQDFLKSLPKELTYRQGWALDVIVLPDNQLKIIEINTNRGLPGNWSGHSFDSRNLGAHIRHVEKYFKWRFKGIAGFLLRNNLGNLKPFIRNESKEIWNDFIEKVGDFKKTFLAKFKAKESSEYFSSKSCTGIMCLSKDTFFHFNEKQRVGIEIELSNLSQEKAAQILQSQLGGRIEEKVVDVDYIEPSTSRLIKYKKKIIKVKGSRAGTLKIVEESNEAVSSEMNISEAKVIEIITNPIDTQKAGLLQEAAATLKANGAIGTNSVTPVSIQVNVEMLDSKASEVMNIIRNWYNVENYTHINKEVPLYQNRTTYVGSYSPGFMAKVYNESYQPTERELFDDFFYRQIAEYIGYENAWEDEILDVQYAVQNNLKKENFDQVLKVFKWNDVRISSLLMHYFPDDWISEYMIKTGWVKAIPLIEFRRPNNDFQIDNTVKSIVGFVQESKKRTFTLSAEMGSEYGIRQGDFKKILNVSNPYEKPYIIRQFLGTPNEAVDNEEYSEFMSLVEKYERRSIPIWVDSSKAGQSPYQLPGESVVFHRLPSTANNIMGKYNPALINNEISKILDHKYVEFAFWEKYSSNAMAKTALMSDLSKDLKKDVKAFKQKMDKEFPNGWVIKGIWDTATQKEFLITDETNLEEELSTYKNNYRKFIDYREEIKNEYASSNPDIFTRKLREREEFTGYRINRFLKKPHEFIVQEKLSIVEEFRVEVIAGKVLSNGSTIPRYQYSYPDSDEYLNNPNIKRVEAFTQEVIDKLPIELRSMTFGMDIALLKDGSIKMIESNPQGNSGFLAYDKRSIKALDKFLEKYPEMVRSGLVGSGMNPRQQVQWIYGFIENELKLNFEDEYPHLLGFDAGLIEKSAQKERSCFQILGGILKLFK